MQLETYSTTIGATAGALLASAIYIIALKIKKKKNITVRVCPKCGTTKVRKIEDQENQYYCTGCHYVFEDRTIPEKVEPELDKIPEPPKIEVEQPNIPTVKVSEPGDMNEDKKKKTRKRKKKKKKKIIKEVEAVKEEKEEDNVQSEEAPLIEEPLPEPPKEQIEESQ